MGKDWRSTTLAALAAAAMLLGIVLGSAPGVAFARGEEAPEESPGAPEIDGDEFALPLPVDQLVDLPGDCPAAAPIEPGFAIDCFFEILPGVDEEVLRYADLLFDGLSWPCHVEAGIGGWDRLACPNLLQNRFDDGTVDFALRVEGEVAEAAANATSTWANEQAFSLYGVGEGESIVFDGRPLSWFSYSYQEVEGLFLTIRERSGGNVIDTIEIEVADVFDSSEGSVVPDLPVGRYRMWPCVGASPSTCEERPGGRPFQVIDGEPLELVDGHNRRSADRINILFVSSGLTQSFEGEPANHLPELARTMLTVGGPTGADYNGNLLDEDELAPRLLWGPMAIEPLASHLDRFNFWYLPDEIADEEGVLFSGLDATGDDGFDLPNLHITALYNDGADFTSDARRTSFEALEPADVPARGRIRFGDARVWVPRFDALSGVTTLAHEWGHGLFGLRDEYYGFDERGIAEGYPNCAPDLDTAQAWWGGAIGEVDPFAEQVLEVQELRLQDPDIINVALVERTTIEISAGGCYSDVESLDVFRPSADSLMNSEVPVFGAINRQRVQAVLDRFSGRGPMVSLADMSLTCEGLTGFVTCRGELLTHLDKPLSIVAINSIPCEFGNGRPLPGGAVGPVPVTCSTIASPSEPIELTFKAERSLLEVADMNPLPRPVPVQGRLIPEDTDQDDKGREGSNRTVAVGVLLSIAAIALAFVERRRRSLEAAHESTE